MKALVLSGGAFRGAMHIGALKALEESGYKPDLIVGTSMGSIVGGAYAYGYTPDEIQELLKETNWFKMIDPDIKGFLSSILPFYDHEFDGVLKGDKILERLHDVFHGKEEKIPFYAMATDIINGDSVALRTGKPAEEIRASMSLPGILKTMKLGNRSFVDGGINNNFAINVALEKGADSVVAVNAVDSKFDWDKPPRNVFETLERFIAIRGEEVSARQKAHARNELKDKFTLIEPDLKPGDGTDPSLIDTYIEQGYTKAVTEIGRKVKQGGRI